MKTCSECGQKLKNKENKYRRYRIASGILTIIASSFFVILFVAALMSYLSSNYYDEFGYSYTNNLVKNLYAIIANVSVFTLFVGVFSGILILLKRLFYVTLLAQFMIILGALLSVGLHILSFVFFGVPILILGLLSLTFLGISQREFLN